MQTVNSDPDMVAKNFTVFQQELAAERKKRRRYIVGGATVFSCVLLTAATLTPNTPVRETTPIVQSQSDSTTTEQLVQAIVPAAPQTNNVDAALISALKQQNQWQEERMAALTQEIEGKNLDLQGVKAQADKQKMHILELQSAQSNLQAKLAKGQEEYQDLTQKFVAQQTTANAEIQAKHGDREVLESKLAEMQKQADIEKQNLVAKIFQLQETSRQLTTALEDKKRLVSELEDKIDTQAHTDKEVAQLIANLQTETAERTRLQKAIAGMQDQFNQMQGNNDQVAQLNNTLQNEFEEKTRLQKALAALQEKFDQEHNKLLAKDALFTQLSESLRTQKDALQSLEQARQSLNAELTAAKQQYTEHLAHLGTQTKAPEVKAPPITTLKGADKRVHLVNKGETLSGISQKYYGSAMRWNDIYEANKDVIPNKNQIKPGTELVIP